MNINTIKNSFFILFIVGSLCCKNNPSPGNLQAEGTSPHMTPEAGQLNVDTFKLKITDKASTSITKAYCKVNGEDVEVKGDTCKVPQNGSLIEVGVQDNKDFDQVQFKVSPNRNWIKSATIQLGKGTGKSCFVNDFAPFNFMVTRDPSDNSWPSHYSDGNLKVDPIILIQNQPVESCFKEDKDNFLNIDFKITDDGNLTLKVKKKKKNSDSKINVVLTDSDTFNQVGK